ncbi:peptidylprolyl isomerase [Bdellovibrionota bacterium FG-2]
MFGYEFYFSYFLCRFWWVNNPCFGCRSYRPARRFGKRLNYSSFRYHKVQRNGQAPRPNGSSFSETTVGTKGAAASNTEIVEFLIDEKIITQEFPVSDSEVEQSINSIQTNNKLDRVGLRSALSEQGFSFEDYFSLIRMSRSKTNLIDRDIRTKVTISDDDVKNFFYNNYSQESASAINYHLQLISISTRSFKTTSAAYDVASNALKQLKAGESFEEVAKRVSDHPSASTGGDLGELTEDQISPDIRAQLKSLAIGKVSNVFGGPSSNSYFILKLVDKKSSEGERFEKMKGEIRNHLFASEYQHQLSLWLSRQRQNASIHISQDTLK